CPHLCGLIELSSTGVLLSLLALVIQPSSDLPSKRSIQPSAFSWGVSSLSPAKAKEAKLRTARKEEIICIFVTFVFLGGTRHGHASEGAMRAVSDSNRYLLDAVNRLSSAFI